jgi:ribose 5-phosphate isomerase A
MNLKQQAALKALDYVQSGMVLGLGSGSTSVYFIDFLGEKLKSGELKDILGVPTSLATANRAKTLGIPLATLTNHPKLDLAVDGADEVDPQLNLIKGLGRALLREKIIEIHTKQFVVIVDESKLVKRLGQKGALPVEIVQFEMQAHIHWLNTLGCTAKLWLEDDGRQVLTDNGNNLALCYFDDGIPDVYELADKLNVRPGIVEHGLFLNMATRVIVAGDDGIRLLEKPA